MDWAELTAAESHGNLSLGERVSVILLALRRVMAVRRLPIEWKTLSCAAGLSSLVCCASLEVPVRGTIPKLRGGSTLMIALTAILKDLRAERGTLQTQLRQLDRAVAVLQGLVRPNSSRRSQRAVTTRRPFSLAARHRMAAAQKARWAKWKSEHTRSASGKNVQPTRRVAKPVQAAARPRLSAGARKRIAAAQRARWASWRAKQTKKKQARTRSPSSP
jgi:hypothetical protein